MLLKGANHRRTAWLGLFALWLQMALSFGHIHAEDFAGLGATSTPGVTQLVADRGPLPGSPLHPAADGLAHEACSICAAVALAGNLVLPKPVTAVPSQAGRGERLPIPDAFAFVAARYRIFQSRAPPTT